MKNFLEQVVKAQQELDRCDTIHKKHCQGAYNTEFALLEAMWVGLHKWEMYKRQIVGAVRTAVQAGSQVLLVCLAGGPIMQIEDKRRLKTSRRMPFVNFVFAMCAVQRLATSMRRSTSTNSTCLMNSRRWPMRMGISQEGNLTR